MTIEEVAALCHAVNTQHCENNGDSSQKHWAFAEEWQRATMIKGVVFRLENPQAPDSAQHEAWAKAKFDDGWIFGEAKDAEKKTHPCLVPHSELPPHQQFKDVLFRAVVQACRPYVSDSVKCPDCGSDDRHVRSYLCSHIWHPEEVEL